MSAVIVATWGQPAARAALAVVSRALGSRSVSRRLAPCFANGRAAALPMPLPAPAARGFSLSTAAAYGGASISCARGNSHG